MRRNSNQAGFFLIVFGLLILVVAILVIWGLWELLSDAPKPAEMSKIVEQAITGTKEGKKPLVDREIEQRNRDREQKVRPDLTKTNAYCLVGKDSIVFRTEASCRVVVKAFAEKTDMATMQEKMLALSRLGEAVQLVDNVAVYSRQKYRLMGYEIHYVEAAFTTVAGWDKFWICTSKDLCNTSCK